jgi:uncharacterized protein (DUF952 family)
MKLLLHITQRTAWDSAQVSGSYAAPSLATEGFIHCSTPAQVVATAERFYANQRGLILLVIDPARVQAEIKYEPGADKPDELFPHIYGPLNLNAVERVVEFEPDDSGRFHLPEL